MWSQSTIVSWLWTSAGWFMALIFCFILSIERQKSDKKINEANDKHQKLRISHSQIITLAKEYKSKMQEAVTEKKAAYRSNAYLLDRLEQTEPKQPIIRKKKD